MRQGAEDTVVSNAIQRRPKSFVVSSFKTVHFTKVVQVKIRHYNPNYSTALIRFATIATMEAETEGCGLRETWPWIG